MDNDWTRVPNGHPEQCETQGCMNKRIEGARFCPAHGGNKGIESAKAKSLRNYRLAKWHQEVLEKSNSGEIKSLTEEIGMLRQIIQEHWNQCSDESDLLLKSGPLSDLLMKVNTLVTNCNAIDKTLGNLIDKEKVVQFAQAIINIISPVIPEDQVDELINKIESALNQL